MNVIIGILIPFLGTILGSSMVFFMKNTMNKSVEKLLLGFASGVMIAASIWSLLIPSIEMSEQQGSVSWLPATIGFLLGIIFLLIIDRAIPYMETNSSKYIPELSRTAMLVFAVTLHNIPEGMAVGVAFAGAISNSSSVTLAAALALAIGMAVQNFPEGAIISMPLKSTGNSKLKSFFYGVISGIVEPIAAFVTILLTSNVITLLPYLLSFAAGAMIYVVVEELIPEAQNDKSSFWGTIGVTFGFLIMMILDVTLG